MIGKNVSKWLKELVGTDAVSRDKAVVNLSKTSEHYFDDKKVTPGERATVLSSLVPLSNDPQTSVRVCVVQLVGLMRLWTSDAELILRNSLSDPEPKVRTVAVWATGHIGEHSKSLVSNLLAVARDQDREVRWRVPWALGRIREWNVDVRKEVIRLTRDPDELTSQKSYEAILRCCAENDPEIVSVVKNGLSESRRIGAAEAAEVVAVIDGDWTAVKQQLEKLLGSGVHGYEAAAIRALCRRWPEMVRDKRVNAWLESNRGYWWVDSLLAGENPTYKRPT